MCPKRSSGELDQFLIVHQQEQLSYVGLKLVKPWADFSPFPRLTSCHFQKPLTLHKSAKNNLFFKLVWFDRNRLGGARRDNFSLENPIKYNLHFIDRLLLSLFLRNMWLMFSQNLKITLFQLYLIFSSDISANIYANQIARIEWHVGWTSLYCGYCATTYIYDICHKLASDPEHI